MNGELPSECFPENLFSRCTHPHVDVPYTREGHASTGRDGGSWDHAVHHDMHSSAVARSNSPKSQAPIFGYFVA